MILSGPAIRERLEKGEIFRRGTWVGTGVREASYVPRVAQDGMLINGKSYPPGAQFPELTIKIEPGTIAILSTVERFDIPGDLVGHPGVRFDYAVQGLTALMGIQVDPLYGSQHDDERLYLRFANLGNEAVVIHPEDSVFNIEFHEIKGTPDPRPRQLMWRRLISLVERQSNPSWSYATRVQADLKVEVEQVRRGLEPLVMFGIFLVAATLLGVVIAMLLSFRDTPTASVPAWVTTWGWAVLMIFISIAALVTASIGGATVYHLVWRSKRR
jgi:deoxycytidine triphosphate deaminase